MKQFHGLISDIICFLFCTLAFCAHMVNIWQMKSTWLVYWCNYWHVARCVALQQAEGESENGSKTRRLKILYIRSFHLTKAQLCIWSERDISLSGPGISLRTLLTEIYSYESFTDLTCISNTFTHSLAASKCPAAIACAAQFHQQMHLTESG